MTVGIIGAGASGMMAAIAAYDAGARVILFEKNDRIGKKILATGNGKCNFTNLDFDVNDYYTEDKEKLQKLFSSFSNLDTIQFFEDHGMMTRSKNGYLYPYSEQASTVLDLFRRLLDERNIQIVLESEIKELKFHHKKQKFQLEANGKQFQLDRLIISAGSRAGLKKDQNFYGYDLAKEFGHHIKPIIPALVQLRSSETLFKVMTGVRCQARISLFANKKQVAVEEGELQLTDYGISGIPVFQLSRTAGYALSYKEKVHATICFFPEFSREEYDQFWKKRVEQFWNHSVEDFLLGLTNKKINQAFMKKEMIKSDCKISELSKDTLHKLKMDYYQFEVPIISSNGMEHAQVLAGGVSFSELTDELESMNQSGLYFTGEVIDVDGRCGGYNLQFAWTTGVIAGTAAARG